MDTCETARIHHSHGGEYDDRGQDNAYPLDLQPALDKLDVAASGPRDLGPEIPSPPPKRMAKKMAMVRAKKDGRKEVVTVDVHHPGDEVTVDEEEGEPDQPDSESSDGEILYHLRSDVEKGTPTPVPATVLSSDVVKTRVNVTKTKTPCSKTKKKTKTSYNVDFMLQDKNQHTSLKACQALLS